ncbi:MAG: hypothetical protein J6T32_03115 [Paludibacteraceae bacterium]|nr:hypothetical protein [Paludibacteraceae bacterium]
MKKEYAIPQTLLLPLCAAHVLLTSTEEDPNNPSGNVEYQPQSSIGGN